MSLPEPGLRPILRVVNLPTEVERQLEQAFPETEVDEARTILRPLNSERVLSAVVALSEGHLDRLRHFTQAAQTDYRDVLFWAEIPPAEDEPKSYEELRKRLKLPPETQS